MEHSAGPTLQEIQRLEAERERRERQAREAQEARLREEQRRLDEQEQVSTVYRCTVTELVFCAGQEAGQDNQLGHRRRAHWG